MSFKTTDKQLLKKYNQIWKRVEKLLKIEFDSKPFYGDNNKYIKAQIKIYGDSVIHKFSTKKKNNAKRKRTMQVFINNSVRFCYQSKKSIIFKHFWKNANMNSLFS